MGIVLCYTLVYVCMERGIIMTEMLGLIGAIVTGVLSLVGVIVTNSNSNRKVENQIQMAQAITDTKLENLTEEVKKHNEFATKIPVMENRIDNLEKDVRGIKDEIKK